MEIYVYLIIFVKALFSICESILSEIVILKGSNVYLEAIND